LEELFGALQKPTFQQAGATLSAGSSLGPVARKRKKQACSRLVFEIGLYVRSGKNAADPKAQLTVVLCRTAKLKRRIAKAKPATAQHLNSVERKTHD
jgi:hypothetical protein